MRCFWTALAALLIAVPTHAQEAIPLPAPPKLVTETWYLATLDDKPSGYLRHTVHAMESKGTKFHRASRTLLLTVKRFDDIAKIEAVTGTDELSDGKVIGVFMRQGLAEKVDLVLRGTVNENSLHVVAEGKMKINKDYPWDSSVVGTLGELNLVAQKKPKPGDTFEYTIFEPIICSMVKVSCKAEAYETVEIANQKPNLLRISSTPAEVAGFTLPASSFWFDANYQLIKSETVMPGMGHLVIERTTKEIATKPYVGPDLGYKQSLPLRSGLRSPRTSAEAVYRFRLSKEDKNAQTLFANNDQQSVHFVDSSTIEVTVHPLKAPPAIVVKDAKPDAEFLDSNYFITSADALVAKHAADAVGQEQDPWAKAQKIERWVHQNMKNLNFAVAMAPASEVAKTLRGDCTEYAMLAAAMARAVGVPSRTAIGLVYVDGNGGRMSMLAMHMWTEVWVRGQWIAIDATLGRGSIGVTHIKITHHSWHEVATMNPLMPVMRVMVAEPKVEIVDEK